MRISKIQICDFRGFPGPESFEFSLGSSRNLLVYGENGSGKSSLFQALREFLTRDPARAPFSSQKNIFSKCPPDVGFVTISYDDGTAVSWTDASGRPSTELFEALALRTGCLDYRALLRTNFGHDGDVVNLFGLTVEELLGRYQVGAQTIGSLWKAVPQPKPKSHYPRDLRPALRFVNEFNKQLKAILPTLVQKAQELVARFPGPPIRIDIDFAGVEYDKKERRYRGDEILLKVKFRGEDIRAHQHFLNEARLSAIALSLFLAGLLLSTPRDLPGAVSYPRVLVLDDVLIGVDLANRLPVLDIIEKEFVDAGWQVFLLTFDRSWYEVAGQRLRSSSWRHYELFTTRVGSHEQPLVVPDEEHLYRALKFVEAGQVKAAAAHVRSAFELVLKSACFDLGLPVKYHPDPRKVMASELWSALKSAEYEVTPSPQFGKDGQGRPVWWQPKPSRQRVVPITLVQRIDHAVSWVLNPLSHSQTVDRYRTEIEDAIFATDELQLAVKQASALRNVRPIALFEMLLSLLKARVVQLQAGIQ